LCAPSAKSVHASSTAGFTSGSFSLIETLSSDSVREITNTSLLVLFFLQRITHIFKPTKTGMCFKLKRLVNLILQMYTNGTLRILIICATISTVSTTHYIYKKTGSRSLSTHSNNIVGELHTS